MLNRRAFKFPQTVASLCPESGWVIFCNEKKEGRRGRQQVSSCLPIWGEKKEGKEEEREKLRKDPKRRKICRERERERERERPWDESQRKGSCRPADLKPLRLSRSFCKGKLSTTRQTRSRD
ncbi:Hypothetical predicted protein [Podarcis lilfordi]|uniref:Uncharacterized protein n=1 Tax=Podarcis lilfordi TaxID=74358 RepID=A0AA35PVQ9_9SAUR|nr:Hypothetical predicted protein [Podarcis lilfordi]